MQFYSPIIIKFALGIICLIVQINLMGKGNLAPTSAMDQVQNYVLGGIIGGFQPEPLASYSGHIWRLLGR